MRPKGRKAHAVECRKPSRSALWRVYRRYHCVQQAAEGCSALAKSFGYLGYEFRVKP
jgi:hypothetical protein